MQRKFFLLLVTSAVGFLLKAQTVGAAIVYAYRQPILPGTQRGDILERTGKTIVVRANTQSSPIIYISSHQRIYPVALWIDGKRYGVNTQAIRKTPIVIFRDEKLPQSEGKILVPKTTQCVWRLTPMPDIQKRNFNAAASAACKSAIVVVYKMSGRFYFNALNTMESGQPQALD